LNYQTKEAETMTDSEKLLLIILQRAPDSNTIAVVLQSYIAEMGPLSEAAGAKVRKLLQQRQDHESQKHH
jgi:hypothetical protein